TEDPEAEVPVAFRLVAPYNGLAGRAKAERLLPRPELPDARDPYTYTRRSAAELPALQFGGSNPVRVALDADVRAVSSSGEEVPPADFVRMRTADAVRHRPLLLEVADAEAARAAPPETALLAPLPGADDAAMAQIAAGRALPVLIEADGTNFEAAVEAVLARSARCE